MTQKGRQEVSVYTQEEQALLKEGRQHQQQFHKEQRTQEEKTHSLPRKENQPTRNSLPSNDLEEFS